MSVERQILEANTAFYEAFKEKDIELMNDVWAEEHEVICIHPGWQALCGREAIMSSFDRIMKGPRPPEIECVDPMVFLQGDLGVVICSERLGDSTLVATNMFLREGDAWVMVHHHAGPGQGFGLTRHTQSLH